MFEFASVRDFEFASVRDLWICECKRFLNLRV